MEPLTDATRRVLGAGEGEEEEGEKEEGAREGLVVGRRDGAKEGSFEGFRLIDGMADEVRPLLLVREEGEAEGEVERDELKEELVDEGEEEELKDELIAEGVNVGNDEELYGLVVYVPLLGEEEGAALEGDEDGEEELSDGEGVLILILNGTAVGIDVGTPEGIPEDDNEGNNNEGSNEGEEELNLSEGRRVMVPIEEAEGAAETFSIGTLPTKEEANEGDEEEEEEEEEEKEKKSLLFFFM